mgnify:CR=1 FL=1
MIDYEVVYQDGDGEKHKYTVASSDVRAAMAAFFKLVPSAKRIISCIQTPANN